jgi:hypothetical protein
MFGLVIATTIRRMTAVAMVAYFVLPALPGVTFSGDVWSAMALAVAIFAASLGDLIVVSLGLWYATLLSLGRFRFDFSMETRSPLAPIFLSALFLSELSSTVRRVGGIVAFDGELPLLVAALTMALAVLAVSWPFDQVLFDLNLDRPVRPPHGGKKIRIPRVNKPGEKLAW